MLADKHGEHVCLPCANQSSCLQAVEDLRKNCKTNRNHIVFAQVDNFPDVVLMMLSTCSTMHIYSNPRLSIRSAQCVNSKTKLYVVVTKS